MSDGGLFERAERFLSSEIDGADRTELERVLERAREGDPEARRDLEERFQGPLRFGTAGIRGILGAGESRMNRALVLRVTYGLVRYLLETVPDARKRGIVLARDGRFRSDVFQSDAASVAAALGVPVRVIPGPSPTPLLAFAVQHFGAACGIMLTASHNPPEYNGYKVYWGNGAQIVPPIDENIAARIDAAPGASEIPRVECSDLWREAEAVVEAYLDALASLTTRMPVDLEIPIAYSALHGCGQKIFFEAMKRRGFSRLAPVAEQAEPHPGFPTVSFPNPEEPGTLDLVLALARDRGSELVLVHDPDADRLGAAARRSPEELVVLNGNEIGVLLAHHVLEHTRAERPLVVSTVVSSRMLSRMARERGVRYLDTLTGFKWIANEAMRVESEEGVQFVFGYEEALGYTVGDIVRDKDGIGAGIVLAEMAASLRSEGRTLLDVLDDLRKRHGLFQSRQKSVTLEGAAGAARIDAAMTRLRSAPPERLAGERIARVHDLSMESGSLRGNVLLYDLESGGRVAVRPSGTEPKIKLYLEVVEPFDEPEQAYARAEDRLNRLSRELSTASGLEPA